MQKFIHLSAAALLAVLAFSGCKKNEQEELIFQNRATQEVTLDVYNNLDDYSNGENPVLRKVLPPNDKLVLPSNTLIDGKTYYIDWYNEDNSLNNWFNDVYPNSITTVTFTPKQGGRVYYTSNDTRCAAKNTFLNGIGTDTKWIAIDAFQYSKATGYVSVWAQATNDERYQTLTIRKNFTATREYKTGPAIGVEDITFKVHNISPAYLELYDGAGANLGYILTGRNPYSKLPDYASSSTDTALAMLPNSELQFLMVKQK